MAVCSEKNLYGSVINGSASGEVTDGSGKTLGGLIGSNLGGNHSNLKASGWVNAGANSDVGLIGHNRGGNHSTLGIRQCHRGQGQSRRRTRRL